MRKAVMWHKPNCSTSRAVLARLREAGIEPELYLYMEERPGRTELARILKTLGMKPSQLLRAKEAGAKALVGASDSAILTAMAADPILIERPIVITEKGAVLARPKERVEQIL